ncbi:MAG: [protein-PII] uridylyltransferase [Deltaproteobacteria bacterium]
MALWEEGLTGTALLEEHTALVDRIVEDAFAKCRSPRARKTALVALGGYGRRELFPYSDVDILLLHPPMFPEEVDEIARAVFHPLWDAGLDLAHGVRTVDQCMEDAAKDFFFRVSLLDARLIAGDRTLFNHLEKGFHQVFVEGKRREFVETILCHRELRLEKFGAHAYLLEPNIKEALGGLRDIHAILWTAKILFGLEGLTSIQEAGLLSPAETRGIEEALDLLVRLRNRLHFTSRRKNDRLYFEYQVQIAKDMENTYAHGDLVIERFMQAVYQALDRIATVAETFFEHVNEVISQGQRHAGDGLIEPGIEIRSGRVYLENPQALARTPLLAMKVFAHAARLGRPVHHRTRRAIAEYAQAISRRLRTSKRAARLFLELLEQAQKPLDLMDSLLNSGLLSAFLPEFERVRSLMQHDVYHVSTVDRHLIETVAELHRLKDEEKEIYSALSSPRILFLAGLLHDIGKGSGHGHASRGAELAKGIARRMGISGPDAETLIFLVEQHLFLMETAQRRDLDDEAFVIRCARRIGTPERLRMLYLLSVADARATGPNAWNAWKASLLQEFYLKLLHLLESKDFSDPDRIQAVAWMRERVAAILGQDPEVLTHLLPEDYLLSFTPEAITRHLELERKLATETVVLVPEAQGTGWSLLLLAKDRTGLLARIFGVLALHDLDVRSAELFTLGDGTAVDLINCTSAIGIGFDEQDWDGLRRDLALAVQDGLDLPLLLAQKPELYTRSLCHTVGMEGTRVAVANDVSDFFTVVEVYTRDRIGLLFSVTQALADLGLNVTKARIATHADQVVDVFFVQNLDGEKLTDPGIIEELRQSLSEAAACPSQKTLT